MNELLEYIENNYPEIIEEHKRATTPFYYETGVEYHPISSGFGCGQGGSSEKFVIVNGDYIKGELKYCYMRSLYSPDRNYVLTMEDAHKQMKRVDESVAPLGNVIPDTNRFICLRHNGCNYTITQGWWRDYNSGTLRGRIIVHCEEDKEYYRRKPYHELYIAADGKHFCLKHVHSYDSGGREQYNFTKKISVREFKELIFGDPKFKLINDPGRG